MAEFALLPMIPRALSAEEARESRRHQGIPSIQMLPSGRLFAVYYTGKIPGEGMGNYVVLTTSTDNGCSWKEVQVVAPCGDEPQARAFDSEIWLAPDGALWWFWTQCHSEGVWGNNEFDGRSGVWAARCAAPDTDFPVWDAPRRLGEGVMMNKPEVLPDGTWVLPASLWAIRPEAVPDEFKHLMGPGTLLSHDGGQTFEQLPGPKVPANAAIYDEHCVIQRKDGSLWMLIRTKYGIWQSTSVDGGRTWTDATPTTFGSTCSRFALRRMPSGALLFVFHQGREHLPGEAPTWYRERLTAWISDDDGVTWLSRLLLDERADVSYPSVTFGEDGFIYVIYDRSRLHLGQILLTRFTENDLRSGEFLTPGCIQRMVVGSFGKII